MRFQFPLYKIFLIFVPFAAAFGALAHLGAWGIVLAALIGTTGGALILVVRNKNDLLSAAIVMVGSLTGALISWFFMPAVVNRYGLAEFATQEVLLSAGAVAGGLLFSWASKR